MNIKKMICCRWNPINGKCTIPAEKGTGKKILYRCDNPISGKCAGSKVLVGEG
jgi:hypothetical protein